MVEVELNNICINVGISANSGSEKLWAQKHCDFR